jgi:hypothetical protein
MIPTRACVPTSRFVAGHHDTVEHLRQLGAVTGLTARDQHRQTATVPVDDQMSLGGQPTAGAAHGVIGQLIVQILVIRVRPGLTVALGSCRLNDSAVVDGYAVGSGHRRVDARPVADDGSNQRRTSATATGRRSWRESSQASAI